MDNNKKKSFIPGLVILILLVIVGFLAGFLLKLYQEEKKVDRLSADEAALAGEAAGKEPQEISELLNAEVAEGMLSIGISAEPVFEENGKKGNIGIENPEGNKYIFRVDISLEDTGENVYSSGLIAPGHYIDFIGLSKELPAGDYPALATFTAYAPENNEEEIAKAEVALKLHVMDGQYYAE